MKKFGNRTRKIMRMRLNRIYIRNHKICLEYWNEAVIQIPFDKNSKWFK